MEKLVIEGGERLRGSVSISGAKNAVLPVLAATLLQKGIYEIGNVPHLKDVITMINVLGLLGAKSAWVDEHRLKVDTTGAEGFEAPYDLVKEMRASVLVLGALAGGRKRAIVSYPGGCAIGERPIDLHLKGLSLLGCDVGMHEGYVDVRAENLRGARVHFEKSTVGGTENILMAAVLARGETVIENAAMEPEVVDLGVMLQGMGARIEGLGTPVIFIQGVEGLTPCNHDVIPDRIEAGTFLVASGLTRGNIAIENANLSHLTALIEKLREAGMEISEENGVLHAAMSRKRPTAFDIRTLPYPGFPTDMQAQVMTMMSIAKGVSVVTETIFENRMMHAAELRRLGADVMVVGNRAVVRGVKALQGAKVMATDLRASACLILAGLCAYGTTEVSRIYHIDRGYESIEKKLGQLGAKIERKKMKVWHLEQEWDAFLEAVISGREQKKADVRESVRAIKKQVLESTEEALHALSARFDGWRKDYPLRISVDEIKEAAGKIEKRDLPVLKGMIRNVRLYHRSQKLRGRTYKREGLVVKEESVPVERALVYVPGGQVPYPSSLVMGVVPAQIAGVKEIYVTTPTHDGVLNPYIAACCLLLGIRNVFRLSGAQAIYAFAHGTGSIPRVDMIVGPGNAYVEEAKRDIYGRVGIDMLAGPSELAVLLTGSFPPQIAAWDLFSQAEHDEMATVGLFSPSRDDLYVLMREMERLLAENPRRATVEKALEKNGYLVYYANLDKAVDAINRIAPEHLEVIGDESVAKAIRYPGIIYVGPETCVSMGDYYIGTNHVLPTGGAGRFSSGLSVDRFTKRKVLVKIDKGFLDTYGAGAMRLAEIEGLYAHGRAIKARKELLQ